ncbi:hypothetical protein [Dysgonomonas sp. ZJ709]|uniref:hypothetical protein n=1 Tax=Dysgonomonas sp. ZJ709 TaxID=2709797 RepID=UPI0013ED63C2|nr:hypothetical protein [Dysgonomonas sp. ZJ709]
MAQLQLTDSLKLFFDDDNQYIWNLILSNNTDVLLAHLSGEQDQPKRTLDIILGELFSVGESFTLENHDFVTIQPDNSSLFNNLVKLLYALDINGEYDDVSLKVIDKLFLSLEDIVANVQKEANDYPENPIGALVWMEAAGIRSAFTNYAYYYKLKEEAQRQLDVTLMKTKITLAIMGHYKNMVGPDMIESAQLMEQVGNTETAMALYAAVKSDFENVLDWFMDNPQTGANQEDIITLESLRAAYQALDRLNNSDEYSQEYPLIDEILRREYIEDDESDDKE